MGEPAEWSTRLRPYVLAPQKTFVVDHTGIAPLVFVPEPGVLQMGRDGLQGILSCTSAMCGNPDTHPYPGFTWSGTYHAYLHSSTQQLHFTAVPIPLNVVADATEIRAGDLLFFSAVNPKARTSPKNHHWFYAAGDTASAAAWADTTAMTRVCANTDQDFCYTRLPSSGRMYVAADVGDNGARAINASPVIRVLGQAKLALTCTGDLGANRVTRGQQITCTAAKDPASAPGELKITGWSFDGRARTDGDLTSTEWKGIIARRGKVEVRGAISGAALRDEQTIRVERRGWSVMQFSVPRHVVGLDAASMADYPPAGLAYGRFRPEWPDFTKLHAHGIDAGPNTGLWFLPDPIQLPQPLAFVHPALYFPTLPAPLGPGLPGHSQWLLWYNDQNGRPVGTCRPQEVTQFRNNVEVHEGVTGATKSHWGVGNRVLTNTKLHERFEALTSDQGADDLRFQTNDTWQKWLAGPYRSSQSQFDTSDYPNVFNLGCSLDSNPNDSRVTLQ